MLLDSPSSSHAAWRVHGANWIGRLDSSEARGTPPPHPSDLPEFGVCPCSSASQWKGTAVSPGAWRMESSTSPTWSSSQTSGKGSSCSHFHNPTHELFCFLQGNVGLTKSV